MRFLFEKFPENSDFQPEDEGYKAICEPSYLKLCLMAVPIIVISVFIIGLMFKIRFGMSYHLSIVDDFRDFFLIIILIPIHELLHLIVFPDKISSEDIYIGSYRGSIYVTYLQDIRKERLLFLIILPIIVLTIIPIGIVIFLNINYLLVSKIALINMILSSMDVITFYGILKQIPANAKVRNKGHYSYWKY